jgi:hypothetical protein
VLTDWDLRHLYVKLIDEQEKLDWFLSNVVTTAWHFEHDAGKPFAQMVKERIALYPDEAELIEAYAARWLESVPGPIPARPRWSTVWRTRVCRSTPSPISAMKPSSCSVRPCPCWAICATLWCRAWRSW